MASAKLSILVLAVGALKAAQDIGKVDKSVAALGKRSLGNLANNMRTIGVVAGGVLATQVYAGIRSLEELETATTSVQGAIDQMGQSGQVNAQQVATWADQIEASIGAAFDDKAITAATATLIRYGKVAPANLQQAMTVMTDLAAKTGDVESASTMLAKALADPAKAAGKLARQGVILTKAQQDQIKAMVEANDLIGAQNYLLDELARTTTGAAAASQGPFKRSMSVLRDVIEDAQRALAIGFLPVLERVAKWLSTELAKPAVMAQIRSLGEGLARAFEDILSIAQRIPWDSVASAMKLAGQGAKFILDAFTSMPPWVQTAVLTGWGLNKLSGGGLTGLFKIGLDKAMGGLGLRGATPANPVFTKEVGVGGGGPGGVPGGGRGLMGLLLKLGLFAGGTALLSQSNASDQEGGRSDLGFAGNVAGGAMTGFAFGGPFGAAIGATLGAVKSQFEDTTGAIQFQTRELDKGFRDWLATSPSRRDLEQGLRGVETGIRQINDTPFGAVLAGDSLAALAAMKDAIVAALASKPGATTFEVDYPLQPPKPPSEPGRTRSASDRLANYIQNLRDAIKRERDKPNPDIARIEQLTTKLTTYTERRARYIDRSTPRQRKYEYTKPADTRSEAAMIRQAPPVSILSAEDRRTIQAGLKVGPLPPLPMPDMPTLTVQTPKVPPLRLDREDERAIAKGLTVPPIPRLAFDTVPELRVPAIPPLVVPPIPPVRIEKPPSLAVPTMPKQLADDTRAETAGVRRAVEQNRAATDRVRQEQLRLARFGEQTVARTDAVRGAIVALPRQIAAAMPRPLIPAPVVNVASTTTVTISARSTNRATTSWTRWSGGGRIGID